MPILTYLRLCSGLWIPAHYPQLLLGRLVQWLLGQILYRVLERYAFPISASLQTWLTVYPVLLSLIVVFSLLGNVTLAIIRSRLSEKSLWSALVENFKWMPMMAIFFGGVSFHLSLALLSHMFSIKMEWGATAKEKVDSNFFKEIPKIFKSFKWMYAILIPLIGGMIYLGNFAPRGWEIKEVSAVVPMAVTLSLHALLPLLLNPSLMIFNY